MRRAIALLAAIVATAGCSQHSQSVAPAALAANPSSYDGQDVTVSGTAKSIGSRQTRRGTAQTYQLCDTGCINVIAFGDSDVSEGSQVTVSGRFRTKFGRRHPMADVLIVGGQMGGGGGAPSASP